MVCCWLGMCVVGWDCVGVVVCCFWFCFWEEFWVVFGRFVGLGFCWWWYLCGLWFGCVVYWKDFGRGRVLWWWWRGWWVLGCFGLGEFDCRFLLWRWSLRGKVDWLGCLILWCLGRYCDRRLWDWGVFWEGWLLICILGIYVIEVLMVVLSLFE